MNCRRPTAKLECHLSSSPGIRRTIKEEWVGLACRPGQRVVAESFKRSASISGERQAAHHQLLVPSKVHLPFMANPCHCSTSQSLSEISFCPKYETSRLFFWSTVSLHLFPFQGLILVSLFIIQFGAVLSNCSKAELWKWEMMGKSLIDGKWLGSRPTRIHMHQHSHVFQNTEWGRWHLMSSILISDIFFWCHLLTFYGRK